MLYNKLRHQVDSLAGMVTKVGAKLARTGHR
jgi:hypothetical protein